MDFPDPSRVDIFDIYRRYCEIRCGKAYKEEQSGGEDNDEAQRCKLSRDALSQLLKFVDINMLTRISVFDELFRLMSKLQLMADFSEFSRFYDFVFFMCRHDGQKNITVSKAIAGWRLVLAGRFRLLNQWCNFVQENQRYNISEDTWQQVLAFSRCVHENLEGYDQEGAWPVLIDDFVEHMYRVLGSNKDIHFFCNCGDSESQADVLEDHLPGLKITPGLKRKLSNLQECMMSEDILPESTDLNLKSHSKRNRSMVHRQLDLDDDRPDSSIGDCMEVGKQNSPMRSSKSPCAVEGCLSKGFAGLFSTRSYLQLDLDKERRVSFT